MTRTRILGALLICGALFAIGCDGGGAGPAAPSGISGEATEDGAPVASKKGPTKQASPSTSLVD